MKSSSSFFICLSLSLLLSAWSPDKLFCVCVCVCVSACALAFGSVPTPMCVISYLAAWMFLELTQCSNRAISSQTHTHMRGQIGNILYTYILYFILHLEPKFFGVLIVSFTSLRGKMKRSHLSTLNQTKHQSICLQISLFLYFYIVKTGVFNKKTSVQTLISWL